MKNEMLVLEIMGWVGIMCVVLSLYLALGLPFSLFTFGAVLFIYAIANQYEVDAE